MKYLGKMIPFIALLLLSATCWATLESQTVAAQEIDPARFRSPREVARKVMSSLLGTPALATTSSTGPDSRPTVEYLVLQAACAGPAVLPQSRPYRRHLAIIPQELRCLEQPFNYDICLCRPAENKLNP